MAGIDIGIDPSSLLSLHLCPHVGYRCPGRCKDKPFKDPLVLVELHMPPLFLGQVQLPPSCCKPTIIAFSKGYSGELYLIEEKDSKLVGRTIHEYDDCLEHVSASSDGQYIIISFSSDPMMIYFYDKATIQQNHHDGNIYHPFVLGFPPFLKRYNGPEGLEGVNSIAFVCAASDHLIAVASTRRPSLVFVDVKDETSAGKISHIVKLEHTSKTTGFRHVAVLECDKAQQKAEKKKILSAIGTNGDLVTWDISCVDLDFWSLIGVTEGVFPPLDECWEESKHQIKAIGDPSRVYSASTLAFTNSILFLPNEEAPIMKLLGANVTGNSEGHFMLKPEEYQSNGAIISAMALPPYKNLTGLDTHLITGDSNGKISLWTINHEEKIGCVKQIGVGAISLLDDAVIHHGNGFDEEVMFVEEEDLPYSNGTCVKRRDVELFRQPAPVTSIVWNIGRIFVAFANGVVVHLDEVRALDP